MNSRPHASGLRVLLPAALACCGAPGPDLPPIRFETDHFQYHARPGVEVCDGLGDWLEHHYRSVGGALGAALPAGQKIQIYVFLDEDDLSRNACPPEANGCASGHSIYQYVPYVPHELIHAYSSLIGSPPLLFDEALARVLGCGPGVGTDVTEPTPDAIRSALTSRALRALAPEERAVAQDAAAAFVRHLIDRDGLQGFLTFYGALERDSTEERVLGEFRAAFGIDLDTALAEWANTPARTESGTCLHLAECATPALAAPASDELAPACVYGVAADGFLPEAVIRRLSLGERTGVVLGSDSRILVALKGCSGDVAPGRSVWFSDHEAGEREELWTDLDPGDYWLLAGALTGGEDDFAVSAELGPPLFADRCAESVVRAIAPGTRVVYAFGSLDGAADDDPLDGVPDLAVGLEVAANRLARMLPFEGEPWLCSAGCPSDDPGCDGRSISTELAAGTPGRLVLQGNGGGFGLQMTLEP